MLLKYSKLSLVRRVRIRKTIVSFIMSVSQLVKPFIDRKFQGESYHRDFFDMNMSYRLAFCKTSAHLMSHNNRRQLPRRK